MRPAARPAAKPLTHKFSSCITYPFARFNFHYAIYLAETISNMLIVYSLATVRSYISRRYGGRVVISTINTNALLSGGVV